VNRRSSLQRSRQSSRPARHAFRRGRLAVWIDQRQRIVDFTIESRLPTTFVTSIWLKLGGLMAYLPSEEDRARRGAVFVDKILKGARPGDLPVEQPTKFELIINLKTPKPSASRSTLAAAAGGSGDRVMERIRGADGTIQTWQWRVE